MSIFFVWCGDDVQPMDEDELNYRRLAMKHGVLCLGWMKLFSISCFVGLFFLVQCNSKGHMGSVLQYMTLASVGPQVLTGLIIFVGALNEKAWAMEVSLWLCLMMASYKTVLGTMGAIYFIRTGYYTLHFLLAVIYCGMALCIFTVLCHDVVLIYEYKRIITAAPPLREITVSNVTTQPKTTVEEVR